MLNVRALKAEMARHGYNNTTLAKELGISTRTLTTRLHTGDFGSKEIEVMIKKLHLQNPMEIFFCSLSNLKVTNQRSCEIERNEK